MLERSLIKQAKAYVHSLGGVAIKNTGTFAEKGLPDLTIVLRGCPPIFVEFKIPKKMPTPLQFLQLSRLREAGAATTWVDSIDGFKRFIDECRKR